MQATSPIRVLIADDDELARALVSGLLRDDEEIEVVAAAEDTAETIALAVQHHPDVIMLDLDMPGGGGWKAAERIRDELPNAKMIVLTALDTAEAEYQSMRCGATNFLAKGASKEQILDSIKHAAEPLDSPTPRLDALMDPSVETPEPLGEDSRSVLLQLAARVADLERRIAELER
jgi:DNA-binding NarL/FixJ family response regulator